LAVDVVDDDLDVVIARLELAQLRRVERHRDVGQQADGLVLQLDDLRLQDVVLDGDGERHAEQHEHDRGHPDDGGGDAAPHGTSRR
jgi:hypothetical protein